MTRDDASQNAVQLAEDLAEAHRRVHALNVADAEKALASRRLLAINDAAKHDVVIAARRLQSFLDDLDDGRIRPSEHHDGQ